LLLLLCGSIAAGGVSAQDPTKKDPRLLFLQGNEAMERKAFDEAILAFKGVFDQGVGSGEVHFNLANAYVKAGQLGPAILHYRLAAIDLPRDPEVDYNLRVARDLVVDKISRTELPAFLRTLLFPHLSTTLLESRNLFLATFILALVLFHLRLFLRSRAIHRLAVALAVVAALFGISLLIRTVVARPSPEGVVLPPEVIVRSGPTADYAEHFKLHEGVEVAIEEERAGWIKIDVDGRKGWLPSESLGRIH
jgi:tetratricopeptide (TPR) repeat protein